MLGGRMGGGTRSVGTPAFAFNPTPLLGGLVLGFDWLLKGGRGFCAPSAARSWALGLTRHPTNPALGSPVATAGEFRDSHGRTRSCRRRARRARGFAASCAAGQGRRGGDGGAGGRARVQPQLSRR